MDRKKLQNYILTGSIHTLAVKSPGIIEDVADEVSSCIVSNTSTKNDIMTTSIINPNKLLGDCFNFSDFETALNTILAGAGIKNYHIVRADMRLDNYSPEHFKLYAKLNRYLISALAVTYKVRNAYRTTNLFSHNQLNIAIKNDYFECENYDRAAKSEITENYTEPAQSRLEERTISRRWRRIYEQTAPENLTDLNLYLLEQEFTVSWFERWDKAIQNLDLVHEKYNDELERIYKEDKNAHPCRFRSLTDFLIQYQDCIFTKVQMVDLLSRFEEVKNPVNRAENHKKRWGIEYFSKKDVQQAIEEIKRATLAFFDQKSSLSYPE